MAKGYGSKATKSSYKGAMKPRKKKRPATSKPTRTTTRSARSKR